MEQIQQKRVVVNFFFKKQLRYFSKKKKMKKKRNKINQLPLNEPNFKSQCHCQHMFFKKWRIQLKSTTYFESFSAAKGLQNELKSMLTFFEKSFTSVKKWARATEFSINRWKSAPKSWQSAIERRSKAFANNA